jgi:hypothetical protein
VNREAGAGGLNLQLHQVEPRDQLGYGVLHLEARVHLQEVKTANVKTDACDAGPASPG